MQLIIKYVHSSLTLISVLIQYTHYQCNDVYDDTEQTNFLIYIFKWDYIMLFSDNMKRIY